MKVSVGIIDFLGHSSKVKVSVGIIDKYGVCGDATLCIVMIVNIFSEPVINNVGWWLAHHAGYRCHRAESMSRRLYSSKETTNCSCYNNVIYTVKYNLESWSTCGGRVCSNCAFMLIHGMNFYAEDARGFFPDQCLFAQYYPIYWFSWSYTHIHSQILLSPNWFC